MLSLIAVLSVVALLWVWSRWRSRRSYWTERGVPHDTPHPFYGSLTFTGKENAGQFMRKVYERFGSSYVGIWLFWRPALIINSPEIARRVLIKDSDNFRNRLVGSGSAKSDPIGGLNLFAVSDPIWTSLRRRLTPIFTSAKLRAFHDLNVTKSKQLLKRVDNDLKQNNNMEIRTMFADYTTDIIGAAAFGVNCDAVVTGASPMRTVTRDFMSYSFIRGVAWTCIFFLPEVVSFFKFTFFPKHTIEYFRKVYQTVVAQRGDYKPGSDIKDLMDALLKMKHDAIQNNEEMHDDLVIAQAAVFLQGGFDTTAVTLTFISYELAFNTEAQEKMYQELVDAKKKLGSRDFDASDLSELPYMNAVIKEILRKYPPMGWLDRIAEKPYKIDDNLTIPAGTPVYVNAIGMHYDPEYYPDPDDFIPERFLPENMKDNIPYMPFGDGPRKCIGKRFAEQTTRYAMASLFMKYQVRPKPNAKKPTQIELEKRALFLMPGEDMYVDFVPRKE